MSEASERRLPEIDRLRGFVMVLMALDHMRDFFDADAMRFYATDLSRTYPLLFFTRIVTHLCAPTFAFLAGVGAYLYGARIQDPPALARFLATRGLWLILLDVIVVSPVWGGPGKIELGTLWGIGCGLLALAPLSFAGPRVALVVGAAIVAGHNLLDGLHAAAFGAWEPLWRLLHEPGALPFGLPGSVAYPALAWIGVVAFGYGIGPLFTRPAPERDRALRIAGLCALTLFFVLRFSNFYGDPRPWGPQKDATFTLLAFLNVTKYPPSLLYLLATLGISALLLPPLGRLRGRIGDILTIFGRTPLFFYVLHLYVGVAGAILLALARGYSIGQLAEFAQRGPPPGFGAGLSGAYAAWAAVVCGLYPLCVWFARLKDRRPDWWWLRYL